MKTIKTLSLLLLLAVSLQGQTKEIPVFNHSLTLERNDNPSDIPQLLRVANPESSINVLAVMVEFPADSDDRTTGDGKFDLSLPAKKTLDAPPHNRSYFESHLTFLENYFRKASDGKLAVHTTLIDSVIRVPNPMRFYSPQKSSTNNIELGYLMRDTWHAVDSLVQLHLLDISYSQYNAFLIFHAGAGRDIDLVNVYGYDPTPFDIPSIYLNGKSLQKMNPDWSNGFPVTMGNTTFNITNSMILPETETREQVPFPLSINGLLAASVGSYLGLPDLFNTKTGRSGIGRFGLMDGQSIFSWNGAFPPEPSAWEKKFLGWVQPNIVSSGDTVYNFPAVTLTDSVDTIYQVLISAKEYFLVENRNRDANRDSVKIKMIYNGESIEKSWERDTTGFNADRPDSLYGVITDVDEFDWSLPGGVDSKTKVLYDGGLLIWHIDEVVIDANLGTNSVNADAKHRGVNLMEADGSQDIGQSYDLLQSGSGTENGWALDFWFRGHSALLRKELNAFTPTSYPGSGSNYGANSHIYIGNTTSSDTTGLSYRGSIMKARIKVGDDVIRPLAGFPKNLQRIFAGNSISVADLNGDGQKDILVAANTYGTIAALPGIIAGWQTNGMAIQPYYNSSGILVQTTNQTLKLFFGKPAVGDINADQVQDFGIVGMESFFFSPPKTWFNFYMLRDQNNDSLADDLTKGEIASSGFSSIVMSDSFYCVPNGNLVLVMKRSGNQETHSSVAFPDSSYIRGICVWRQPDEFVITGVYGEIGIFTSAGMIRSRNLSKHLWPGVIAGVISPTIGKMIVTASDDGLVYLLDENLNAMPGFPSSTNGKIYLSPALADIDDDGQKDIIVFSGNKIYTINAVGNLLDNFPIKVATDKSIWSPPIVADIDGNGTLDIVAVTQEGLIVAYDKSGKMATGFPVLGGIGSPAAFYLPADSTGIGIGLAVASDDGYVYAWRTGTVQTISDTARMMPWSQYMHDAQNTGLDESTSPLVPKSNEFMPTALAYNWPNPVGASDDFKTYIRYFLSDDAKVHIRIFDPAGDLVTEFDGPGYGGFDNEISWNVSKIQSGIYFVHIDASGSNKSGYAIIKIAVVK
jgi:hypothetical protein